MSEDVKLILASASPRRAQLLQQAGYSFEIVISGVDEQQFEVCPDAAEYAGKLALAKAREVAMRMPGSLVLGADTVVELDGRIMGKAEDRQAAQAMLEGLFSRPHEVITGVALVGPEPGRERVESEITRVFPADVSNKQIQTYLDSGQWRGKAGAYGIQETADEFVDHIDGSFTNVIGLPLELVKTMLCEAL